MEPIKNSLHESIQASLYGIEPDLVEGRKLAVKAVLQRAMDLVDAGLLGCIIITELKDREGSQVQMTPIGDQRLILQTATQLVRQGLAKSQPQES